MTIPVKSILLAWALIELVVFYRLLRLDSYLQSDHPELWAKLDHKDSDGSVMWTNRLGFGIPFMINIATLPRRVRLEVLAHRIYRVVALSAFIILFFKLLSER